MCVMEVRAGQRSSTIAQACAHNISTVERDADMFRAVLVHRGDRELAGSVEQAQDHLRRAYAIFLEAFGEMVADEEVPALKDHHLDDHLPIGNERTFIEAADHDARLARVRETR